MDIQETLDLEQIKKIIKFDGPVTSSIFDVQEIYPSLSFGEKISRFFRNASVCVTLRTIFPTDTDEVIFADVQGADRQGQTRNIQLTLKDVEEMVWRARSTNSDTQVTVEPVYEERVVYQYCIQGRYIVGSETIHPLRRFHVVSSNKNGIRPAA